MPVGEVGLTWHNNYALDGLKTPDFPGGLVDHHTYSSVTEWALGVTPWFEAGLYLPLFTHSSNQGIWYAADGATPKLIARTGASAPGGGTWVSFKSLVLPDSSNGGPLFTGMLALGKGGVTIGNNVGLWGVDSTGDAQLILRTGQIVAVEGSYRIIQTFKALGSYPHSLGTAHGYDDAGNLYVTAIFTDGSQAMLKITPP